MHQHGPFCFIFLESMVIRSCHINQLHWKRKRGREKEGREGEVGSTCGYTGEVNKEAMPEDGEGEGRKRGEVGSTRGYTGEVNKEAMPEEGEGEGRKRGEVGSVPLLATSRLKYDHCLSVMRYHTLTLGTAVGGKTA